MDLTPDVVNAVLHHMNDDHTDDSLIIVRAFINESATSATMVDLDAEGGYWTYTTDGAAAGVNTPSDKLKVNWSIPINERPDIRKAVVFLYRAACEKLGILLREEQ